LSSNDSIDAEHKEPNVKTPNLKAQFAFLVAGLSLAMPAFAQSPDAKYCADLKDKFEQYVSDGNEKGSVATSLDVEIAKGKCSSDPASAIPVFEKALKGHRITLPPRS
jgi:hypothetical protein